MFQRAGARSNTGMIGLYHPPRRQLLSRKHLRTAFKSRGFTRKAIRIGRTRTEAEKRMFVGSKGSGARPRGGRLLYLYVPDLRRAAPSA
jgi:hypothetical protein